MNRFWIILLFFMFFSGAGFCQENDSIKKVKVLPVPTFGYSPETRTYLGAVALFTLNLYNDTNTRTSNAKAEFNYTWNKQLIVEGEWNHFTKGENWYSSGLLHYSRYPDLYYGVGETPFDFETLYQSNRIVLQAQMLKHLGKKIFLGPGIRFIDFSNIQGINSEVIYEELRSGQTFGPRLSFHMDSRNNLLNSTKGAFVNVEVGYNFSTNDYAQLEIDARKYFSKGRFTMALRAYNAFVLGNDPPFFDYALLGGDQFVRGYYFGRFRDRHLTTCQGELRGKLIGRIGLAAFGGISAVYPELNKLGTNNLKPNAGLGLRILMDKTEQVNLRFDYAIGAEEQTGFYISFGESF